jgi:protoheme ferro-lyase
LLGTMVSLHSLPIDYKEKFSWEYSAEFRSSGWAVCRELSSARKAVKRRRYEFSWQPGCEEKTLRVL